MLNFPVYKDDYPPYSVPLRHGLALRTLVEAGGGHTRISVTTTEARGRGETNIGTRKSEVISMSSLSDKQNGLPTWHCFY